MPCSASLAASLCASLLGQPAVPQEQQAARVYAQLPEPREHPDYTRRHVRPPSWDTFGDRVLFTVVRGFGVQDGRCVGYEEELDRYTEDHGLGEVVWPHYTFLYTENLDDVVRAIADRGLFLFDIWGYVPGSGPGGDWRQFEPPPGALELFETTLGDRWLGMDVGEQDGRYVGSYAQRMTPISGDRLEQYLNFQRHFERMCDDLGNKMAVLLSLNFGHHLVKEGVYTLVGAETAQGLPNGQVYYSFIRGAAKQYGLLWFGNASIFNRWGYKVYGSEGRLDGYAYGPTKGTSLGLLKRLMYSHMLYNSAIVGFEAGWFEGEQLSPIGRIQQSARQFAIAHGPMGVMLTPVAVMTDFLAGWSFPRHLYTGEVYRVWGNLPYGPGDYLTHGVLDMLYPGYANSSYYHDESGFMTPTPYGDCADCLLSDAPQWLLERYPLLIVAGELAGGIEVRDKLAAYAGNGGHLVITAGSLARLPGGIGGVRAMAEPRVFEAGTLGEPQAFALLPLELPENAVVRLRCGAMPAVAAVPVGRGRVTVLASPFGVAEAPAPDLTIASEVDKPLPNPYPLLRHVSGVLDEALREQTLFEVGDDLAHIVCRRGPGEYRIGVFNTGLAERRMGIVSRVGPIAELAELPLDRSERDAVGFVPEGYEDTDLGANTAETIAGGDVRIFDVRVGEDPVEEIPHVVPPPRPAGRALALRGCRRLKEEVLRRPTFFEHFDGVVVDWRYLQERERQALEREGGWIRRQGLRVLVDLSSGVNLYPDLRLISNVEADYERSISAIEDVLGKMPLLGAQDLVLALNDTPENNYTYEQTRASLISTLSALCGRAEASGITLHLRVGPGKPPRNTAEALGYIEEVGADNLRVAPSTAALAAMGTPPSEIAAVPDARFGLWLVAAPAFDVAGRLWSTHARLAGSGLEPAVLELLRAKPDGPVVFDAVCAGWDEEYLEARAVSGL